MSLDRASPVLRDQPVKLGPLPMGTATEIASTTEIIVQKVVREDNDWPGSGTRGADRDTAARDGDRQDLAARVSLLEQQSPAEIRP